MNSMIEKEHNNAYSDTYKLYDDLCTVCYINLFSKASFEKAIYLKDFNIKDKNHMFVFEIANLVSANFHYPIFIDTNFFNRFRLYWRKRKSMKFFKKMKNTKINRTIDEFLDYMFINCSLENENIFAQIYDAYYTKEGK